MKTRKTVGLMGTATLFLGLMTPFATFAQQQTPQPDPQTPSAQSPAPDTQQVQTFTGKIAKSKGNIVLKDDAANTAYQLDNADQVKPYMGKSVKVTGTLDPAVNMIHVSNIEAVPASN